MEASGTSGRIGKFGIAKPFPARTVAEMNIRCSTHLIVSIFLLALVAICNCNRKTTAESTVETSPSSPNERKVKFNPVHFDKYKTVITPDAMTRLFEVGVFLFQNPEFNLLIESYSDDGCGQPYADWLAHERAKDIRDWLTTYGPYKISETRISVKSFGNKKPLDTACGSDSACHANNRRVELTAVKPIGNGK
jgi:outer membrane protein OmpA-like peptidoglycan-associated protein